MADYKFPTELVDLPSQGHFYAEDSPLSRGKVEIKYMTAKEEDILTSQNLIKQGTVIDVLLNSLIVNKDIKVDDLLIGDKNAVLIAARILAYGKEYKVQVNGKEVIVDLTTLKDKPLKDEVKESKSNEFEMELPNTKRKITFKLLTAGDEKLIDKEVEGLKKIGDGISYELTTRFKHMIISIDGDSKRASVNNFVENEFLSRDSIAFRAFMKHITPDVDMTSTYFDEDGEEKEFTVPMTVSFLWPDSAE